MASSSSALPGVPTYDRFADPDTGLESKVTENMTIEMTAIRGRFTCGSCDLVAQGVWESLLVGSSAHWTSLAALTNSQQRYNTKNYKMTDKASWELVSKAIRQVFKSLRKLRSRAQDMSAHSFTPKERFVRAFWTVLTAHRVLDEFIAVSWMGHTDMTGITSEYILMNRVYPEQLNALKDQMWHHQEEH